MKRAARLTSILVVGLVLAPGVAHAFGTTVGQGEEHDRITRAGQWCKANHPEPAKQENCWHNGAMDDLAGPFDAPTQGAVAIPDVTPLVGNDSAHCDNLDYLNPKWDHTYTAKDKQDQMHNLRACVSYLAGLFSQAVSTSLRIVDDNGYFKLQSIRRPKSSCGFGPSSSVPSPNNARCAAIADYGQALHGAEDFYSHTNWGDIDKGPPYTYKDPPGLGETQTAGFLDFADPTPVQVPDKFTGECFPDYGPLCRHRVGHSIITKDEGNVNDQTGEGTNPENPRGKVSDGVTTNFGRAVSLAVDQVSKEWSGLQDKIRDQDEDDANQIICALVQDDTIHDCTLKVELNFTQTVKTTDKGSSTICGTTQFSSTSTNTFTSQVDKDHAGYGQLPYRDAQQSQPQPHMDEYAIDPKAKLTRNGSGTSKGSGCASGGGGSSGPPPCPGHNFTAKAEYSLAVDKHHQVVVDGDAFSNCAADQTELPLGIDAATFAEHALDGSSDSFVIDVHRNAPFNNTISNAAGTETDSGNVETTITGTVTITYGKGDEEN